MMECLQPCQGRRQSRSPHSPTLHQGEQERVQAASAAGLDADGGKKQSFG